jgi:hypothetical protein
MTNADTQRTFDRYAADERRVVSERGMNEQAPGDNQLDRGPEGSHPDPA